MDRGKKFNLDYSRIEFAADARHRVCGCGSSPQINGDRPHFVRKRTFSYRKWGLSPFIKSARPKGKLCRHIMKRNAFETD